MLIDLVLTKNPGVTDSVNFEAPLGKCNHSLVKIGTRNILLMKNKTFTLIYDKGNYEQTKLLFNRVFVKKIKSYQSLSDQHNMLLELFPEALNK